MNRLRVLKQRASRAGVTIMRHSDKPLIVTSSQFSCDLWYAKSYREAVFLASRCAMPLGPFIVTVGKKDGSQTRKKIYSNGRVKIRDIPPPADTKEEVDG